VHFMQTNWEAAKHKEKREVQGLMGFLKHYLQ